MNADKKEIVEYTDNTDNTDNIINKDNKNNGKKINFPNKLTILRIILVPVFMVFIIFPVFGKDAWVWSRIFAAALVFIASITDLIDGILARKLNLVTDFGKFLDPVADKFLVVGALIAITASDSFADIKFIVVWATAIVFFREFAVTSVRLVANSIDGNVIAANFAAKIKTLSQMVCILTILLEEMVITKNLNTPPYLFSYITMAFMIIMTVYSGYVYFKNYWNYIDPTK